MESLQIIADVIGSEFGKEIKLISDPSDDAVGSDYGERAVINVYQILKGDRKDLLKRMAHVVCHEAVGHKEVAKMRISKRAYKKMIDRYTQKDWGCEILPVHIQFALMGDRESELNLKEAGYEDLLKKCRRVCELAVKAAGGIYGARYKRKQEI